MMHVQSSRGVGLFPAIASLWQSGQLHNVRKAFDYLTDNAASLTTLEEKSLIHPYSEFTELQLVVMYGCDTDVEAIIAKGFRVDGLYFPSSAYLEESRTPAICIAIHEHNFHVLDLLLKVKASLKTVMLARQGFWLTALECAIAREDQRMAKFLLSRSPTLKSYRPVCRRNALQFAVQCYSHKLASYLVDKDVGIGVHETNAYGQTAVHYLAKGRSYMDPNRFVPVRWGSEESLHEHLATLRVLQDASANFNAHDSLGDTPLDILDFVISQSNNSRFNELRDVLVRQGALIGWGKRLRAALRYGSQRDAQQLLEENAKINSLRDSSKHGTLRLLLSRRRSGASCAEQQFIRQECSLAGALLEWEGGLHSETAGESDFHWIIRRISCSAIGFMPGLTEHKVARQVHLHVLSRLLLTKRIADIDMIIDGRTPLYLATEMGSVEIVKLLLSIGANDTIAGPSGRPVEVAALKCFPRVVEVLLTRKPNIRDTLVHDVLLIDFRLWFQDPLNLPRDRHETVWLLCAYLGRDFPRTAETIRQRALARLLLNDINDCRQREASLFKLSC
jgi:ankyrin repeat protein